MLGACGALLRGRHRYRSLRRDLQDVRAGRAHQIVTCANGTCTTKCANGYSDCDGLPGNGCETAGLICPIGSCVPPCSQVEQCCNGICLSKGKVCGN